MKVVSAYFITALLLIYAGSAWPQSDARAATATTKSPETRSITGRVVESTDTYLTIRMASGEQIVFAIDDTSAFPPRMPPDQTVRIEYQMRADGTSRTTMVTPVTANASEAIQSLASDAAPRGATPIARSTQPAVMDDSGLLTVASEIPVLGIAGMLMAVWFMARSRRRPHASAWEAGGI